MKRLSMGMKSTSPSAVWPSFLPALYKPIPREWGLVADHAPITDLEFILTLFLIQVAVTV